MTLHEGMQLGSCRIVRLISSGGAGDVYLAEQADLGRQVAVKVLRDYGTADVSPEARQRTIERFTQEARAIAALEHPNILPIYEFGEQDDIYYLVMQYIADGSLADLMQPRGAYPLFHAPCAPAVALPIIGAAASALQYAHDRHVVHLDVKPHNLLIKILARGAGGGTLPLSFHVFLSDFGLARLMNGRSFQSGVTGTPLYTAPEQYEQRPVPASDQYALACVAYQLLTGVPPFQGGLAELHHQHLTTPPPPISARNPTLPPQLNLVFATALEKDPAQRYSSVEAFALALQQSFVTTSMPPVASFGSSGVQSFPPFSAATPASPYLSPGVVSNATGPMAAVRPAPPAVSPPPLSDEPAHPLPARANPLQANLQTWVPLGLLGFAVLLTLILLLFHHPTPSSTLAKATPTPGPFHLVFKRNISGDKATQPLIVGNTAYAIDRTGTLYALNATNGNEIWHFTTRGAIHASPAVDSSNVVYLPSADGTLYALNNAGELIWATSLPNGVETTPLVAGTIVCVGTLNGHLYGLNTVAGKIVWQASIGMPFAPTGAVAGTTAFIGNANHQMYALDTRSGKILWQFTTKGAIQSGVVIAGSNVIFGSDDGSVYAVSAQKGKLVWQYAVGSPILATPVLNGPQVDVASQNGTVIALTAQTGQMALQLSAGMSLVSGPALLGSDLVVLSSNGVVSLLSPKSTTAVGRVALPQGLLAPPTAKGSLLYLSGTSALEVLKLNG